MTSRLSTMTLGEIVRGDYRVAGVLDDYGLDYCCNGRRSLEEACRIKNIDERTLVRAIEALHEGDLLAMPADRYEIDGDTLFFMIQVLQDRHLTAVVSLEKSFSRKQPQNGSASRLTQVLLEVAVCLSRAFFAVQLSSGILTPVGVLTASI